MIGLNSGIDFSLPGNGGPDCLNFQTLSRRFFEAALSVIVCSICLYVGYVSHTPPQPTTFGVTTRTFNRIVEAAFFSMAVVYLLEVGYKFYSLQAIFSVNPCHCLCVVQVLLLVAFKLRGGVAWTYLNRIHLFFLHGPMMAVIFPVTNTLFLPGEVLVYWLEHALLLAIPAILVKAYTVPRFDFREWWSWGLMAYGIWGYFHYLFLLPLAIWTQGNLNSVLCPAISDPFRGPNYKLHALWHQFSVNMLSGFLLFSFSKKEARVDENRNATTAATRLNGTRLNGTRLNGIRLNGVINETKN